MGASRIRSVALTDWGSVERPAQAPHGVEALLHVTVPGGDRRHGHRPPGVRIQEPPQFWLVPSSMPRRIVALSSRSVRATSPETGGAITSVAAHVTALKTR